MSEKFGGLTTTPIKPSAFGGGSGTDKMDKFGEVFIDEDSGIKNVHSTESLTIKSDGLLNLMGKDIFISGNVSMVGAKLRHVGYPTSPDDATNKAYVDTQIGDISSALDELHTYAQSLINGGATE